MLFSIKVLPRSSLKKIFQQFNALINSNIDLNGPSKELPAPPAVKECTTKLLAEQADSYLSTIASCVRQRSKKKPLAHFTFPAV